MVALALVFARRRLTVGAGFARLAARAVRIARALRRDEAEPEVRAGAPVRTRAHASARRCAELEREALIAQASETRRTVGGLFAGDVWDARTGRDVAHRPTRTIVVSSTGFVPAHARDALFVALTLVIGPALADVDATAEQTVEPFVALVVANALAHERAHAIEAAEVVWAHPVTRAFADENAPTLFADQAAPCALFVDGALGWRETLAVFANLVALAGDLRTGGLRLVAETDVADLAPAAIFVALAVGARQRNAGARDAATHRRAQDGRTVGVHLTRVADTATSFAAHAHERTLVGVHAEERRETDVGDAFEAKVALVVVRAARRLTEPEVTTLVVSALIIGSATNRPHAAEPIAPLTRRTVGRLRAAPERGAGPAEAEAARGTVSVTGALGRRQTAAAEEVAHLVVIAIGVTCAACGDALRAVAAEARRAVFGAQALTGELTPRADAFKAGAALGVASALTREDADVAHALEPWFFARPAPAALGQRLA